MAKFINDAVLDSALDYLTSNANKLVVCEGEPTNYSDATTDNTSGGNALGETTITPADFTKADGDVSGRKVTVASKSDINVDSDGTADHLAIIDDDNSNLLQVTTLSSTQGVTQGGKITTQAYDQEIADPS